MEKLNELSFERLRLVNDYILLSKQLESYLNSARFSFSKARTLHGITLTNLADPSTVDLLATFRVDDKDCYKVVESEALKTEVKSRKPKKESDEDIAEKEKSEDTIQPPSFRPFGVLEPTAAKDCRKTMVSALNIICEMATVQRAIKKIDEDMKAASEEIEIESMIEYLKI